MTERGCVCLSVRWICVGAAGHSSQRLLGFSPSWRLCWSSQFDHCGEQWMMMCWWDCSSSLCPVCTGVWEGVCECMCHPGSSWAVVTAELSVRGPPYKPSGGCVSTHYSLRGVCCSDAENQFIPCSSCTCTCRQL